MKLPNADKAYVDGAKIMLYLLAEAHPDGQAKARFFLQFAFELNKWKLLADALLALGTSNDVVSSMESAHGVRYTVDDRLQCPDRRPPMVRTVWMIDHGGSKPRVITVYPLYQRETAPGT